MQTITKKIVNIAMALSLLAVLACALSVSRSSPSSVAGFVAPVASAAPAANRVDIDFFNGRGQEIGEGRPFPLDRVSRGEAFTVTVQAHQYPVRIQVQADNMFMQRVTANGPFRFSNRVPTDPSFDNVYVSVYSSDGKQLLAKRRLPIGTK